ncbi:MAG: Alkane 1-monooxygenase [Promethearchaeota archaeon]|nr:MAG: Alkane 1-monooxygenase [Candidatus Lokiarchaeota archaeon]
MKAYPFSIVYLIPVSILLGYLLGGIFTFLTPFFVFVIVPLLDLIIGSNTINPEEENEEYLSEKKSFRILTWMGAPLTLGFIFWGGYIIQTNTLSLLELIGLTISIGINSGVLGINISHELQHRVNKTFEPFLARIILMSTLYLHWQIEHVTGHHRYVATPEDPATAKFNQSYYSFWFQTVFGGLKSAWRFEQKRVKKRQYRIPILRNRILQYSILQIGFIWVFWWLFGFFGLVFLLLQGLIAFSLLEIINYIEHYGLLRIKKESGRYEPVKPHHSWNSSERLTNWFLFNLQRHSDHHFKPGRRYQLLRHWEDAPQLPTGYAGMVLLALIPPLFKRIMNPMIQEWKIKYYPELTIRS